MLLNNINYPNEILDALEDNKLVIFAGAGVSMGKPTGLPGFGKLADEIADGTRFSRGKKESCDSFLGKLESEGIDVKYEASKIIADACTIPNNLHRAIVNLFKHDIRIVTTNYDQMFEKVLDPSVMVYDSPALPLGNDVCGLVHIHGNVNNCKYMVVTDKDFGKAYLTDSYVSRFVKSLFESYTIVFIGYSYNDTIMKYLTRALVGDTPKHYIITTDDKNNWLDYGLKLIKYPKKCHKVMRESLIKLGERAKRNLSDWRAYFSEINDAPPLDPTSVSEIDYCLEDPAKSRIMAHTISGTHEWVVFLEGKKIFKNIFEDNTQNNEFDEIWLDWLSEKVIGRTDNTFKYLIVNNGKKINSKIASAIIKSLANNYVNEPLFSEYLLLAEPYIIDAQTIYSLISIANKTESYNCCIPLFKKLFELHFNIVYERWSLRDNSFDYRHLFIGEYYIIEDSWDKCRENFVKEHCKDLLIFLRNKLEILHFSYVQLGRADKNNDPWELIMLVLEEREDNHHDNPLYLLSSILLELVNSEYISNLFVRGYILDGLSSESMFVRKLFIKLLRECSVFNSDESFDIIFNNDYLDKIEYKEQVFLLIHKIYNNISPDRKNCLINYIENIEPKDSSEYVKYNWCIWIQKVDPDNDHINFIIDDLESRFHYKPRKYPELDWYISVEDDSEFANKSVDKSNLKELDYSSLMKVLSRDVSSGMDVINHHKQMDVFADLVCEDYIWAKEFACKLLSASEYNTEIWEYYINGVLRADYSAEQLVDLLFLLYKDLSSNGLDNEAAELLWQTVREDGIDSYLNENGFDLFDVCMYIWNYRRNDEPAVDRIIDLSLNTTIGLVLMSTMRIISFNSDMKINSGIISFLNANLIIRTWEQKIVVCILAGHFNLLYYRDSSWCNENLVPLLDGTIIDMFLPAWEGMNYFSKQLNRNTADALAPVFLKAVKHINRLSGEALSGFMEMYIVLMIYVIDDPLREYIPSFYKFASPVNREAFMKEIGIRIHFMSVDSIEFWWNTWLKRYLVNLTNNKPVKPSAEEIRKILAWLPDAGIIFDEVVDIIRKIKLPNKTSYRFLYSLDENGLVASHSNSTVILLTKLLEDGNKFENQSQWFRGIEVKLNGVGKQEMQSFKEALLKINVVL